MESLNKENVKNWVGVLVPMLFFVLCTPNLLGVVNLSEYGVQLFDNNSYSIIFTHMLVFGACLLGARQLFPQYY